MSSCITLFTITFLDLDFSQNKTRTTTERSTSIGALAEIVEALGEMITSYTPQLLQLGLEALADADSEVTSNAAFLVGTLVSSSSTDLSDQYGRILSALQPLFIIKEDKAKETIRARDNACGTVARMILRDPEAVPLEQVLPSVIAALPLQHDFEPYTNLIEVFFNLTSAKHALLGTYLDQLLVAFAQVLNKQTQAKNESAQPLGSASHARLLELIRILPADKVQSAGLQQYL